MKSNLSSGTIIQIIGPVMDISFSAGKMPSIYNALVVDYVNESNEKVHVVCEVQQLLGDNVVRAISMSPTDGLQRGIKVVDLLAPYRRGGKIGLFGGAGVFLEGLLREYFYSGFLLVLFYAVSSLI